MSSGVACYTHTTSENCGEEGEFGVSGEKGVGGQIKDISIAPLISLSPCMSIRVSSS